MSHAHNKSTEALQGYTRPQEAWEPVPVATHQKNFEQRLRGVLARINARVREAVITNDLFGLRNGTGEALVDDVPEDIFDFPTRRDRVRGFLEWLRQQFENEYLTIVGPDRNQFIRAAYIQGIQNVHSQLSDLDVSFRREDADSLVGAPIHQSSLRTLYTRAYEELESVRNDTIQAVRDSLTEGFAEGKSPTDIARDINGRVNSIGKHRSTLIARSEVMNAWSEGTLTRVEEINRDAETEIATGHGEWDAAIGQERTCDFCEAVNGVDLRVSEMRGNQVIYIPEGRPYRLKPPAHPNGRCGISVRVGGEIDTPLSERLPATVRLVT